MITINKRNIILSSVLILTLAAAFLVSWVILDDFFRTQETASNYTVENKQIMLIIPDEALEGWKAIRNGAFKRAQELGIAVELMEENNGLSDTQAVLASIEANVSGIAIYVANSEILSAVNSAEGKNIPVVTLVNDVEGSQRTSCIGISNQQFGEEMADALTVGNELLYIGIVQGTQADEDRSQRLLDILSRKENVKVAFVLESDDYVFDSDKLFAEISQSEDEVNVICCLDSFTTLGVAQTLVDRNRVKDIKIIGSGSSQDIMRLVEKGVVHSTVVMDYYGLGERAVEILADKMEGNDPPEFAETSLYTIDHYTVEDYIKEMVEDGSAEE